MKYTVRLTTATYAYRPYEGRSLDRATSILDTVRVAVAYSGGKCRVELLSNPGNFVMQRWEVEDKQMMITVVATQEDQCTPLQSAK